MGDRMVGLAVVLARRWPVGSELAPEIHLGMKPGARDRYSWKRRAAGQRFGRKVLQDGANDRAGSGTFILRDDAGTENGQ